MKTLLVDMDNCITDPKILEYINKFLNTDYKLEDQTDFYLQNLVKDRKNEFYEFLSTKNLYENCPLKDNCYKVLEKLNKKYDIYIVTSYLWKDIIDSSANNLKNKYNYLKEKLPFIDPSKYIFTTNKQLIKGDISIDDKLSNLHTNKKILFTAWHNKQIQKKYLNEEGITRVNTWEDILKELEGDYNA